MRLSTQDSFTCSEAIAEVRRRADAACQAHDTEEAKRALNDVWSAVRLAYVAVSEAEARTRQQALQAIKERTAA